jgi:predicted phage terminase large subunit-like protein
MTDTNLYTVGTFALALRERFDFFLERAANEIHPDGSWSHAPYLDVLANHVMRIEQGDPDYRQSYVNAPPRSGKSFVLTAAHSAWRIARNPRAKIIIASYSMELAREHLSGVRKILSAEWFQMCFSEAALKSDKSDKVETRLGGFVRATSVEGLLTGIGGDLIILDDVIKAEDALRPEARQRIVDWYRSTVSTRLNDPKSGAILVVMQRLHVEDITTFLRETGRWTELSLPLIASKTERFQLLSGRMINRQKGEVLDPERFDQHWIKNRKNEMGTAMFAAQYQQNPEPDANAIFRKEWFKTYKTAPESGWITISIDTGIKIGPDNDYTVAEVWCEFRDDHYLIDLVRTKLEMPGLLALVRQLKEKWRPDRILVEDAGSGTSLYQSLHSEMRGYLKTVTAAQDKQSRALSCVNLIESGKVWLPESAPWLKNFRAEVCNFPNGKHDDQVDAMTQHLNYAITHSHQSTSCGGSMQVW